jgi:hypothetical protein
LLCGERGPVGFKPLTLTLDGYLVVKRAVRGGGERVEEEEKEEDCIFNRVTYQVAKEDNKRTRAP